MKHYHRKFGYVLLSSLLALSAAGIFGIQASAKPVRANRTVKVTKRTNSRVRPLKIINRHGTKAGAQKKAKVRPKFQSRKKTSARKPAKSVHKVVSHSKRKATRKPKSSRRLIRKDRARSHQPARQVTKRRARNQKSNRRKSVRQSHKRELTPKHHRSSKSKVQKRKVVPRRCRSVKSKKRSSRKSTRKNVRKSSDFKLIKTRGVNLIGRLPYRKKVPVLRKMQSMVVNPDGKSALIGYIGANKKDDQEADVTLRHGHVALIWNSDRNKRFNEWDHRYSRKMGHMQSVTNYNNELAILNNPMGTITKGRIFLFNAHTLKPVKAYRIHVKNRHLGDSLAYDSRNHSFYDAYNENNFIVFDKGNIQHHHGQSSVVFYRLPFRSPCKGRGRGLEVQSIAYNPRDNRLYVETSHRNDGDSFYGIRSVPISDLSHKSLRNVKTYFLHKSFTTKKQEPEGISFDRWGNMYISLRHPERIYRINASHF